MAMIRKTALFLAGLGGLYFLSAFVFSIVGVGDQTLMKIAARNPVAPGGFGFTLQRFQDIGNYQNVDILFLGSSHCYRTFDPRIYARHGLKTFNMGTTGQTPLNTYYLLKRYFPALNPKLVIFDLNYRVIDRDGLECFYDLVQNIPYSSEMMEMALAIRSPHALNLAVSKWMLQMSGLAPQLVQKADEDERYIPGGYVEFTRPLDGEKSHYEARFVGQPPRKSSARTVVPREEQLQAIRKVIRLVKEHHAGIILLTKPEPPYNLRAIANYEEISRTFAEIARQEGVDYFDFNKIPLPLDPYAHFHDREYLNPAGVEIFNPILLEMIYQQVRKPALSLPKGGK